MTAATQPAVRRSDGGLRSVLPAPIWHVGRLLVLALIVEYLVVPQLAGPRKVAHLITQVNPFLLLAGVALEAGALIPLCRTDPYRPAGPAQPGSFYGVAYTDDDLVDQPLRSGRDRHWHGVRFSSPHARWRARQRCGFRPGHAGHW